MKHIFKKLHFGGSSSTGHHDATGPPPSPSPSSVSSPSSLADAPNPFPPPSCAADHRQASSAIAPIPPSPTGGADGGAPRAQHQHQQAEGATMGMGGDYFSSEEEFQMQLALAISASNSEFRDDPHNDQIRAATLLSLGKHRVNPAREVEGAAEALSRRYWDYNVLDYDEKVVDGFYDIFVLSSGSAGRGKMPSLSDLQTNIGDLGFEVIIVNRAIDHALLELEQVVQCILLDCSAAETRVLAQRIAELVTEHMGGPVKDANEMLARWTERSSTVRTSLQTSLMPIGGVNIGLSRHRALLFKVLADKVGIPCKLVKGSHYTGIDDDAINMIRLENEREFLVDLMADPGTLIPADVLSARDPSLASQDPRPIESLTAWVKIGSGSGTGTVSSEAEHFHTELKEFMGNSPTHGSEALERKPRSEKAKVASSSSNTESLPSSSEICYNGDKRSYFSDDWTSQPMLLNDASFEHKESLELPAGPAVSEDLKDDPNALSHLPINMDSKDLFAELNPFQAIRVGKVSSQFKPFEKKESGYQRRRENIASGPGRPPLPLVWKNRSACNEFPNNRHNALPDGVFPRKNIEAKELNASSSNFPSSSVSPRKMNSKNSNNNVAQVLDVSYSPGWGSSITGGHTAASDEAKLASMANQFGVKTSSNGNTRQNKPFISNQPSENKEADDGNRIVVQSSITYEQKEHGKIVSEKRDRKKYTHDRFMGTGMITRDSGSSIAPTQAISDRLDPMLDDVAAWEIPWEDIVIGERIGLGSYGEVYHADWNGTEVAVKKFLDQDFYGDALDEFRSEVRIMRRLRHPNVVLFMGAVTRPPNLSIVTEFLPRGSLYRILHRPNCQIDQKRRIKMALDVAKGMNCLHSSMPTIVHRDLKSPNLLVDKNWNVKVGDFGLSRLKHNTFLSSKSTAGTPEWMAPEVLRNEQSNEKCDVYSFGVILWELATLRMPWSGMNPMQVVGAVGFQNRRLDIPKEIDPLVARIIWECWQTDPSLRPSFAQLTSTLKNLQQLTIPFQQDAQSTHSPQEISINHSEMSVDSTP